MEEALAAIRRAISNDEAGETTLAPAEPRTSREQAGPKPTPEGGFAVPRSNCRSTGRCVSSESQRSIKFR
jgi:hypothetical protein